MKRDDSRQKGEPGINEPMTRSIPFKICKRLNNVFTPNLRHVSKESTTIVARLAVRNTSASGPSVVHQSILMLAAIKREVITYYTLYSLQRCFLLSEKSMRRNPPP